jgi:hypothetical protein
MARTNLVLAGGRVIEVDGKPEKVAGDLRSGWAQLNRGDQDEQDWIWVNTTHVVYVEPVGRSVYEEARRKTPPSGP